MYCVKISSTPCCVTADTSTTATTTATAVAMSAPDYAATVAAHNTTSTAAASSTDLVTAAVQPPSHRQWSRSARHRLSGVDRRRQQSSAADDIASLANVQSKYFTRKLEMEEEQHAFFLKEYDKKMKVLDLQEQYYAAKLHKLTEE